MKRRRYPVSLRSTALSLSKEPALSERCESKGRCGKLSVVNNFGAPKLLFIYYGRFFSKKVINNGAAIRAMLFKIPPLRYD